VAGDKEIAWALIAGNEIVGVDVSDPSRMDVLGTAEVLTDSTGIAIVGQHLWAATPRGGLVGFDVSDPANPSPVGRVESLTSGTWVEGVVAFDGHLVLYSGGHGTPPGPVLRIVDVGDPRRPTEVGRLEKPEPSDWHVGSVYVHDGVVWLQGGDPQALIAVDVSDPSRPEAISRLEPDEYHYGIWLTMDDGKAYVTGGDGGHNWWMTAVMDVTDPTAPRFIATQYLTSTLDPTGAMLGTHDQFIYATSDGQIRVLDASIPAAGLPLKAHLQTIGALNALAVRGALALAGSSEALISIDVANPFEPKPLSSDLAAYYPDDIDIDGDVAYVVTGGHMDVLGGELHTLDVSDPSALRTISSMYREYDPQRIDVSGRAGALVSTPNQYQYRQHQVQTLAITETHRLSRVGNLFGPGGFQDAVLSGDYLYAASPARSTTQPRVLSLVVADARDPADPVQLGSVDLADPIGAMPFARIAIGGGTAFVAAHGYGSDYSTVVHSALHVVDVSNPYTPTELVEIPLNSRPNAVLFAHDRVLLTVSGGVLMYDVSDPAHPVELGLLPTGYNTAVGVQVQGGLVYATAGEAGLFVFQPQLYTWPTPDMPSTPSATSAVATGTPAISTPTNPTRAPSSTPSPTGDIGVRRAYIPVALNGAQGGG
jgi:hypothetical protein